MAAPSSMLTRRRSRRFAVLVGCVLAASLGSAQQIQTLQASHQDRQAVLVWDGVKAAVELDGDLYSLPKSRDRSWKDLEIGDDGWIVAGSKWRADQRRDLVIYRQQGSRARKLSTPGGRVGQRWAPQMLLEEGELTGLVWQEEDAGLSGIRFAQRRGNRWTRSQWLSAPSTRPQLALSAVSLGRGRAIAVWSAYDGQDDEIVFSQLTPDGWTRPQRISSNNRVPDVTPAVAATAKGAVVAWSRFDGHDYRLRLARFEGGRWRGERWLGGAGSAFPVFHADSERRDLGATLIYRTASSSTWNLAEIGRLGYLRRQRSIRTSRTAPPLVRESNLGEDYFSWPTRVPFRRR